MRKLPVLRYSPLGAVFDTWSCRTHQALVTTFASQAALWQMAMVPASFRVFGGTGLAAVKQTRMVTRRDCHKRMTVSSQTVRLTKSMVGYI